MAPRRESDFQRLLRQVQEAELRADKAKQAAKDAELRADEAKQARKASDRRADEAEQARKEEEQARKEEEQARKASDRRADEAEQARKDSDQRNQNTNFSEYLRACHKYLHKPLGINTNKKLTTQGVKNPQKKIHPEVLRPWQDFSETQHNIFQTLHSLFQLPEDPSRLFNPSLSVEVSGRDHCHLRLASEWGLRTYEHIALETPLTHILKHLCDIPEAEGKLNLRLGQGVTFEKIPNSLSDADQEVQDRLQVIRDRMQRGIQIQPPQTPPPRSRLSSQAPDSDSEVESHLDRTLANQYGIYKNIDGFRDLLLIVDYKPPHKLSASDLQRGFRIMNLKEEVIDRTTIPRTILTVEKEFESEVILPTDRRKGRKSTEKLTEERDKAIDVRLQYNADKLVVAVATQTFQHMIENRLEYSYITTGEAFVFLRILAQDPRTLYYHVSEPVREIDDSVRAWEQQTAVAQVAVFCIMAFQSRRRSHEELVAARKQLKEYPGADYQALLLETPDSERQFGRLKRVGRESPSYKGGGKGSLQSIYNLRSRGNTREPPDAGGDVAGPSNSRSYAAGHNTSGQQQREGRDGDGKDDASGGQQHTQRQYCIQKCLVGLTRRLSVDGDCPNVKIHPTRKGKHAINIGMFLDLVRQQLARSLDHDCEPLGLQGARGALFKITLSSHGYVFVGKGTVYAFVPDLLHEGRIYARMESLQGKAVPVCLGNIDLVEKYYLDLGVRIQHMLLMSWAGTPVEDFSEFHAQASQTVNDVRNKRIDQNDVRSPNFLWNEETQRLMLIDFERASIIAKRHAMG
ncbi:MAG: hypothetical protein M1825_006013 [Sarcosagium campestre]|nr:MAG: hypothetical protein M1825_006013 [Sarcosagium campestre]